MKIDQLNSSNISLDSVDYSNLIFRDYMKFRKYVKSLCKNNNQIDKLIKNFTKFLFNKPSYTDKELKNMANFLIDIPLIKKRKFVLEINSYHPKDSDEFLHIVVMHSRLMRISKDYKEKFYQKVIDMDNKIIKK